MAVEVRGLVYLGIAGLTAEPDFPRFKSWLGRGDHAGMDYLERNLHLREDPAQLLAGARTAIIVGLDYFLGDRLPRGEAGDPPRIAQYARLRDYHRIMWKAGGEILADYWRLSGRQGEGRVVVDSAPILERALAARAGGGFIGKNTCLIDPERGSFLLLGEILITDALADEEAAPAPVDPEKRSAAGGCGPCKRCQVHCPTGALDEAYRLDANKCLAYWTIEHRGPIPEAFWPPMRLYFFGCDICQLVCPYNRGATPTVPEDVLRIHGVPDLFAVATMDQAAYERMFGGTPLTRAKREGLVRNALIAMTVTKDARLDEAVAHCGADPAAPVVTETLNQVAAWRARQSSN